jgi:signal transduction histidine kinase
VTSKRDLEDRLRQAQKMEAVGQLTGGLAHDFNNLLTIVVGNLAVLRERHAELPAVTEFVEPALQASRRGVELVKRLLAFSRQQPLEPTVVDVHRLVQGLTPLLRRSLPESIRITTRFSEPSPHVIADANRLESALINIAVNARDAMPDGGELRISITAEDIDGTAAREFGVVPGTHARIEVADTGVGMDPATLARAVEPFFSTKPFGSGSGLGLSMVYGFVNQLNGGISIRSVRGGGTTVTILLPLTEAAVQADE